MTDPGLLAGWTPVAIECRDGRWLVDWRDVRVDRVTQPFFRQEVERAARRPFTLLFHQQTELDALAGFDQPEHGLSPTGFIFHLSRCGSTVVSQMLAASPRHLVVSEPEPLRQLLQVRCQDPAISEEQQVAWLRGMMAALCQPWHADQSRAFIKFDAWDTLQLPIVRRAYPHVPWIFVYRDPVEVVASHRRTFAGGMVPAPIPVSLLGLDMASVSSMPLEVYWAHALAAWSQAALHEYGPSARLTHYCELPDVVFSLADSWWNLDLTDEERATMLGTAAFDPKHQGVRFVDDSAAKRASLPAEIREIIERLVGPWYARLEETRQRQALRTA